MEQGTEAFVSFSTGRYLVFIIFVRCNWHDGFL